MLIQSGVSNATATISMEDTTVRQHYGALAVFVIFLVACHFV